MFSETPSTGKTLRREQRKPPLSRSWSELTQEVIRKGAPSVCTFRRCHVLLTPPGETHSIRHNGADRGSLEVFGAAAIRRDLRDGDREVADLDEAPLAESAHDRVDQRGCN
ncbi:hypothetical protein GCM10027600_36720 [Nocardioides ginsengisegetis]